MMPASAKLMRSPLGPAVRSASVGWSTLRLLRSMRFTLLFLQLGFTLSFVSALTQEKAAVTRLESEVLPKITAAYDLQQSTEELTAFATGSMLAQTGHPVQPEPAPMEAVHARALRTLLEMAGDPHNDEQDRSLLQAFGEDLNRFDVQLQRERDLATQGSRAMSRSLTGTQQRMQQDADVLVDHRQNAARLEVAREKAAWQNERYVLAMLSGLLLLGLIASQVVISQRTNRTLNAPLLLSTLLSFFAIIYLSKAAEGTQKAFVDDLLPSIAFSRAIGEAARTAALIDRGPVQALTEGGASPSKLLATARQHTEDIEVDPQNLSEEQVINALREGRQVQGWGGKMRDALESSRTSAQREAVYGLMTTWRPVHNWAQQAAYPQREPPGKRLQRGPALQTEAALQTFERDARSTLATNSDELRRAAARVRVSLTSLNIAAIAEALVALVLVMLGFAPRLREYR